MTTTWQPGDVLWPERTILQWIFSGGNRHDVLEEIPDHDCSTDACDWDADSQLGNHDDPRPPLAWLHGVAS